jgi:hypothetical protein
VRPLSGARKIERHLARCAQSTKPWTGSVIADDLLDGSAALRPAVHRIASPSAPEARIELGFPSAWLAPWPRKDGIRGSLVLTAITEDQDLLDRLVAKSTTMPASSSLKRW